MAGTWTELWSSGVLSAAPPGVDQSRVEFGGQADQRETITKGRLEVPSPEALQENEGQKQREHEIDDCRRFVLEDMIQAPMGRGAVEAAILDVPTPVACRQNDRADNCRRLNVVAQYHEEICSVFFP